MTAATTLPARARRYLGDAISGIRRAPVEVLATLGVAVAFSAAVELGDDTFQSFAEIAVACLLLLVVAWTGTLLEAMGAWDARRRWIFTLANGLAIAMYAIAWADFTYAAEAWRAGLLVGAAILWLIALPAFGGPAADRVERMRTLDGRILLRLIGAMLYGAALFAGLALALAAVDSLFELELEEEIYAHVWGWIFFVLVPWIVLGGLADYVRPLGEANAVAGVAQRIVAYLVPPLLAIYFLILYAYVVRIFITGEIPKNLVSPLVLAAGGLGTLGLLLFDPRPGERSLARWLRLAPPLLLPLAPLGAWALLVRVDQYGLTEFRVVRLAGLFALALLAFVATVQLVRRQRFALHVVPLAIAALLLLGAVGRWSAMALSRRSQQTRLEDGLTELGIAPTDTGYRAPPDSTPRIVPHAAYEKIRGSAEYLARHVGPEALPPVLGRAARTVDARWLDFAAQLGLQPDSMPDAERFDMHASLQPNVGVELAGGTAYRVRWPGGTEAPGEEIDVVLWLADSMRVTVNVGGRVLYADLRSLASGPATRRPTAIPAGRALVPLTDSAGTARGQFVVLDLWLRPDSTGLAIGRVDALAVIAPD